MAKAHDEYQTPTPVGMKRVTVSLTLVQDFFVPCDDEHSGEALREKCSDVAHIVFRLNGDKFEPIGSYGELWRVEEY